MQVSFSVRLALIRMDSWTLLSNQAEHVNDAKRIYLGMQYILEA